MKKAARGKARRQFSALRLGGLKFLAGALWFGVAHGAEFPGAVDEAFLPALPANSHITSIAVQPDGKVIVAGNLSGNTNITSHSIRRLEPDGSLDESFASNLVASGIIRKVVVLSNGHILVAGGFSYIGGHQIHGIARAHADGSLDETFDNPGLYIDQSSFQEVRTIAPMADGRIMIGGRFVMGGVHPTVYRHLARLNADGTTDPTFQPGDSFTGIAPTLANKFQAPEGNISVGALVNDIEVLPDGKLLIGGSFTNYNGTPADGFIRLNDDASVDAGFAIPPPGPGDPAVTHSITWLAHGGFVRSYSRFSPFNFDFGWGELQAHDADGDPVTPNGHAYGNGPVLDTVQQPDGKLILGGLGSHVLNGNRPRIARLNANFLLDHGFGSEPDEGANDWVRTLAYGPDGEVYVGGRFTRVRGVERPGLARLHTGETLVASPVVLRVTEAVTQVEGRGYTLNVEYLSYTNATLRWLHNDIDLPDYSASLTSLSFPEASLANAGNYRVRLTNPAGVTLSDAIPVTITPAPRTPGKVDLAFRAPSDLGPVRRLLVLPDDRLLVGQQQGGLDRLLPDGSVDETFQLAGDFGFSLGIEALALDAQGRILVGGNMSARQDDVRYERVVRLHENGSIDTSFLAQGAPAHVFAIKPDEQGGILVAGTDNATGKVIRLLENGDLDPGFTGISFPGLTYVRAGGGVGGLEPVTHHNIAFDLLLLEDSTILVGGALSDYPRDLHPTLLHLDQSGREIHGSPVPSTSGAVMRIARQLDGSLLAAGVFSDSGGRLAPSLSRMDAAGRLDASFVLPEIFSLADRKPVPWFENAYSLINDLLALDDGRFLLGGSFRTFAGEPATNVVRLFPDGTRDTSWGFVTGVNKADGGANVYALAVQSDGRVLVGGTFTSADGVLRTNLVRLHGDAENPPSVQVRGVQTHLAEGQSLVLEAAITGVPMSPVRWRHNGALIADENHFTLRISGMRPNRAGDYAAEVEFTSGVLTSAPVVVSVAKNQMQPGVLAETLFHAEITGGEVFEIVEDEQRRLLIAGSFTNVNGLARHGIARISSDGSVDPGFDPGAGILGGEVTGPSAWLGSTGPHFLVSGAPYLQQRPYVRSIAFLPDGNLLVAGFFRKFDGQLRTSLVGLAENGALLETTYPVFQRVSGTHRSAGDLLMAKQPLDERILIAGNFAEVDGFAKTGIVRMDADGVADHTFQVPSSVGWVYDFKPLPDGRILAIKYGTGTLIRLNADGGIDDTFPTGLSPTGGFGSLRTVATLSDGTILIGGFFNQFAGHDTRHIVRLSADGIVDNTFSTGAGPNSAIGSILPLSDGTIWLGGGFTRFASSAVSSLMTMNQSGQQVPDFRSGLGPNGSIHKMTRLRDGRTAIAGRFNDFAGADRVRLAVLHTGGTTIAGPIDANTQREIRVNTQPGLNYTLEWAASVDEEVWTGLEAKIGNGSELTWVLPPFEEEAGYFRVRRD